MKLGIDIYEPFSVSSIYMSPFPYRHAALYKAAKAHGSVFFDFTKIT